MQRTAIFDTKDNGTSNANPTETNKATMKLKRTTLFEANEGVRNMKNAIEKQIGAAYLINCNENMAMRQFPGLTGRLYQRSSRYLSIQYCTKMPSKPKPATAGTSGEYITQQTKVFKALAYDRFMRQDDGSYALL
mmetsp:Transcript_27273/g.82229  ORF Transcript_27273/g.82229 Transcript_27273/m.82229 type:complete len:135 (+) Transcript_27273:299-703(+)